MDLLQVFYENKEEILDIYNTGGSIVQFLAKTDKKICSLFGSKIKYLDRIGKGSQGIVFEINFPNKGTGKYVVKRSISNDVEIMNISVPIKGSLSRSQIKVSDFANNLINSGLNINYNVIIESNGGNPDKLLNIGDKFIIPYFATNCILNNNKIIRKLDDSGSYVIPKNSYLCINKTYSEYLISLLVSKFLNSKSNYFSINFINTISFSTCPISPNKIYQYTFMEKIDSSLDNIKNCLFELDDKGKINKNFRPSINEEVVNSIYIQILHAISIYQTLNIVHGDLYLGNIFIEYINEKSILNETKLFDIDYFEYQIDSQSIFIPGGKACPFIVKIGDWGLSCKYSEPMILNKEVINDGMDQYDGNGAWLPNFYCKSYDPFFITDCFYEEYNISNTFISNIFKYMLNANDKNFKEKREEHMNREIQRPVIKHISKLNCDVIEILKNKNLMGKYYTYREKSILIGKNITTKALKRENI